MVEDGVAHIHNVTVVRDFGTTVEVSAGVKDGDQVILNPPVDLTDGRKGPGQARSTRAALMKCSKDFSRETRACIRPLRRAQPPLAVDGRVDSEDVERIVARWMHLADQNRTHQLVIASAEKRAIAVQAHIGRQRVALQCSRKDDRIQRFLLIGDVRQRMDRGIPEPVPRACRSAGAAPDRFVECLDLWIVRLVPPPFHRPPPDPRRV